jgi:hypothetical protein
MFRRNVLRCRKQVPPNTRRQIPEHSNLQFDTILLQQHAKATVMVSDANVNKTHKTSFGSCSPFPHSFLYSLLFLNNLRYTGPEQW